MIIVGVKSIPKETPRQYPILLKSKTTDAVLLATGSGISDDTVDGIILVSGDNHDFGEHSDRWKRSAFEVFSGEIILKQ